LCHPVPLERRHLAGIGSLRLSLILLLALRASRNLVNLVNFPASPRLPMERRHLAGILALRLLLILLLGFASHNL
jgi:hypothetical protein